MSLSVHGHGSHGHNRSHICEESPSGFKCEPVEPPDGEGPLTLAQLRSMADDAHHASEAGINPNLPLYRRWLQKLNLPAAYLNTLRWYHTNQGTPERDNAAINMMILFFGSHVLETVGGMTLMGDQALALSQSLDAGLLPSLVHAGGVVVGALITIPGFDPGCIALMFLYRVAPQFMNHVLTPIRWPVQKVAAGVRTAFGILLGGPGSLFELKTAQIQQRYGDWQRARFQKRLRDLGSHLLIEVGMFEEIRFHLLGEQEKVLATLQFHPLPNGRYGLSQIELPYDRRPGERKLLQSLSRVFGWNIRSILRDILIAVDDQKPDRIAFSPYLERKPEHGEQGRAIFFLKAEAFPIRDPRPIENCISALESAKDDGDESNPTSASGPGI